jgi:hypothetical protein
VSKGSVQGVDRPVQPSGFPFEVPFAPSADVPDNPPFCFRASFLLAPLFFLFTSNRLSHSCDGFIPNRVLRNLGK